MLHNLFLGLALGVSLLVSPAMAGEDKLGFEGKWATEKALCNKAKNPTGEGVTTLTSKTYSGYETHCQIKKLGVPRNHVYKLTLACDNEGEMGNSVLWMSTELPGKALTSWGTEGKDQGELVRCK